MLAVTVYSIFVKTWGEGTLNESKGYEMILSSSENITVFIVGNIVAFIVALIAIKSFIGLLNKYGFKPWGWYRIIVGIGLLVYFTWFK
jgi:undecaprenyl-diphosphatase